LGETFAARRMQLGMSQTELSIQSGISQSIISRMENGIYPTSTLLSVCAALGLDIRLIPWQFTPAVDEWLKE
jgi:transcriptional regulator with XRE-family HTH domain